MGGDLSAVGDTVQIGIYCGGCLAVTKKFLDGFDVHSVCQQQASGGVAQIMEPNNGQIIFLKNLFEPTGNIIRIEGLSIGPCTYRNLYGEGNADQLIDFLLLLHQLLKVAFRSGNHAENAVATLAFCLVALVQCGHLRDGISDMDGVGFEVKVTPCQTQYFTSAQAIEQGKNDHRTKTVLLRNRCQQLFDFVHGIGRTPIPFLLWQSQLVRRIAGNDILFVCFQKSAVDDGVVLSEAACGLPFLELCVEVSLQMLRRQLGKGQLLRLKVGKDVLVQICQKVKISM